MLFRSVRVKKEGWIDLPGENWIYIVTASAHDSPEIGDLSLAIDNHQSIYLNNGHVCGGIINFESRQLRELKTSQDFFRYFVSDTDYEAWERVSRKSTQKQ